MITTEYLEEGVIVYHWIDQVDMQDAHRALEDAKALTHNAPYVALINMEQLKSLPNDIANMRANVKDEVKNGLKGYVVVKAPHIIKTVIKPLTLLASTTYRFADSCEEAVGIAREILQKA